MSKMQGYTPDTTDDDVLTEFQRKFDSTPEEIIRTAGCVLAGPIPDAESPPVEDELIQDMGGLPLFNMK